MNIRFLRRAGQTKRYHTEVVLKEQNVGEHSFNVAWLCYYLTNGEPSAALLLHALAHDAAEHVTGDIPAPSKRALNIRHQVGKWEEDILADSGVKLPDLCAAELHVLSLSDALDGVLYCQRELELGNTLIHPVWVNFANYTEEVIERGAATVMEGTANTRANNLLTYSANVVRKLMAVKQ